MKKNDFLLTADELSHQKMEYLETLFALGNGQIGVRAGHPLKVNQLYPGNPGAFVNGFFDSEPIQYVNRLMVHSWGQKVIRFYDLDGNLIEVGTPMFKRSERR